MGSGKITRFPEKGVAVVDWQGFYTTRQVSRLTGTPIGTLYEWRKRGIFRPSLQFMERGLLADEGYSYYDVTMIRILKALRDRKLDFDSVGKALRHMFERLGPPDEGWTNERVYIVNNHIYVDRDDAWQATDATQFGQKVAEVLFGDLFDELRELEEGASIIVPTQFRRYVQINPTVRGGEPVVWGTRVPTSVLRTMLKKYKSTDKLAELYKPISKDAIEKAIEYERYLDQRLAS